MRFQLYLRCHKGKVKFMCFSMYFLFYFWNITHITVKRLLLSEAPATEQAELPVFSMETCVSFEAPVPNSTSDVHTFPHEKLSTPHQERTKDVSSENLLPSNIRKIDNTSDITDHSVRENTKDSSERVLSICLI